MEDGVAECRRNSSARRAAGGGPRLLGPSSQLEVRLAEGEAADVAILTAAGANSMIVQNRIVDGSLVDIARSALGVAVRAGAPKPDISSVEAFKQALLAAKSIAVSKPVGGGQSGVHMKKVFEQLGIAEAMNAKAKYGQGGPAGLVGLIVRNGEADIGMQQIAELMGVPGLDIVSARCRKNCKASRCSSPAFR